MDGCGSIGARREEDNKVIIGTIGIGLGRFSSNTKLSSLHGTFQEYFVQKVQFTLMYFVRLLHLYQPCIVSSSVGMLIGLYYRQGK